ncbi:MAG: hypothetical protein ACUZ8O_04450 [Candidatus Anammoxibacter sp.]
MDRQYTKYQQSVIKGFYDNYETIKMQKLSEMVTSMYLETSEKKKENGWKKIKKTLLDLKVSEYQVGLIMEEKSLELLAKKISTMF